MLERNECIRNASLIELRTLIKIKLIYNIFFSAGAGIGIAGGVTGGAATISEKVVNSKQMKVAKEALISDQESTLELQSQIEALR